MEVLRERPPRGESYEETRPEIIFGEIAPHPLIYAAHHLGRAGRTAFPMLKYVYFASDAYVDEDLWLTASEATQVLDELRLLRQVCRYEHFIPGLEGRLLFSRWCDDNPTIFNEHLNQIEYLLQIASQNQFWVRLML